MGYRVSLEQSKVSRVVWYEGNVKIIEEPFEYLFSNLLNFKLKTCQVTGFARFLYMLMYCLNLSG